MAVKPELQANASISDCERLAKETNSYDRATFELVGPTGRLKAQWLDAYMGLLRIDGHEGFIIAKELDTPQIHCENFAIPVSEHSS